jgi:putative ABC transport system permease protein
MVSSLFNDFRYAARSLRRAPLFAGVAIASVALGIGATSAIFTLLDQVVLRALPVTAPQELVQVRMAEGSETYGPGMGDGTEISYAMFRDVRDNNEVFSGMFCRFPWDLQVSYGEGNDRVTGELVSGGFFQVLGVPAELGRTFTSEDDRLEGGHPVAMLGYGYWQSRFGADPSAIGRTLIVNGQPLTIVGVSRRGFAGLDIGRPVQVWLPMAMQPQMGPSWLHLSDRRVRFVQAYGRLRPSMTAVRAQAGLQPYFRSLLELEVAAPEFAAASQETRRLFLQSRVALTPAARGHSGLKDSLTAPLWILMAVAGGVLLIACLNVANLLLARGASRSRELALRLALGAGRRRVVRLLLVESLLLAAGGAALGLVLAQWGAALLLSFFAAPDGAPAIIAAPDARVLAFTVLAAALAAIAAGLAPAFQASGVRLAPALKAAGGTVVREQPRLRKALVVAQVGLSFLLLAGAGLFLRSLDNLLKVDPGFQTTHVLSFSVDLERSGYKADAARQFARTLQDRLATTPGVTSLGYALFGVIEGGGWGMGFTVEGHQPPPGKSIGAYCNAVSPGFFTTLGIPIMAGRGIADRDDRALPDGWPYHEAVVNEAFVQRYLGGASPVGLHLGIGEDPGTKTPIEIVGVARNTKYIDIREKPTPQVYFPYVEAGQIENLTVYVRTVSDPAAMTDVVRRQVAALDSSMPIYNVRTLDERVEASVVNERLIATLSAMFSGLATLLAVVGLYGVMAYTVARRTREIGIRMALGAVGGDVARRVLGEAGRLVLAGLALGLAGAWGIARLVQSVETPLYGVQPLDAVTLGVASIGLVAVSALAAFIPARRAAGVSPMSALRDE